MRTINSNIPIVQPLRFALSPTHRNPNPSNLTKQQNIRIYPQIKTRNITNNYSKSHRLPCFHSANVSREKICIQDQAQTKHLQFNKDLKNRLKPLHKRTRSNCVDLLQEEEESNFSNSLQNISEEIIEIPFANKIISPRNNRVNPNKEGKIDLKYNEGRKNTHFMSSSAEGKISFQRKSTQKIKQIHNKENILNTKKYKELDWKIPKPQKLPSKIPPICLSHFNLKPIKITQKGSIVYIALHKQTSLIYAIKSIKKRLLLPNIDSFIQQLKLSLIIQHPNIAKIYGFFSEGDNFYIIKQFIEEGCIFERQIYNEGDIGCQLNQFMNAVLTLIPIKGYKLIFNPRQLSQTYGISKLTTISLKKIGNLFSFSDKLKTILLSLIDRDRINSSIKDNCETNSSLFFHNLNKSKEGSFFYNKLKEIIEQSMILSQNQLLMIWQSDFAKLYRSKSLMRQ